MLGMLMGSMFDAAFGRFSAAFEKRADAIYGTRQLRSGSSRTQLHALKICIRELGAIVLASTQADPWERL